MSESPSLTIAKCYLVRLLLCLCNNIHGRYHSYGAGRRKHESFDALPIGRGTGLS